jgi:PKD repeat protein
MTSDSGNLSIDFLVGFTIFILAFIWVVSMIPGLMIGLQSYTIDYDAVAYRTGVILVEDPGEPALPKVPWEINNKRDVIRFGLAVSKETPNILSQEKVNRFFCSTVFSYPDDYQKRAIFGDYPYRFNISLLDIKENKTLYIGDNMSGSYGTIRRLVQIKGTSNATINWTYMDTHRFINGDNETHHEFSIVINNTKLLLDKVRDPAYQINPARENLVINITDINSTLGAREKCFNINLTKIYAKDEKLIPILLFKDPVIDGVPYHKKTEPEYQELPYIKNNISLILDPTFLPWSNYPQVYLNLTFNLVKNTTECPDSNPAYNFSGSQFLNNTYTSPFDYNYHPDNVTQPNLRDAVVEVNIGSGFRTPSETVIAQLIAEFESELTGGMTVQFNDMSTGSPVEWAWDFGDGNTSTMSDTPHTYPGEGDYTVTLTVKNSDGISSPPTSHPVHLRAPVAAFSGAPTLGPAPLPVSFTDGSTNNPTSWKWEYNETIAGIWTQFSAAKNPPYTFPAGTYDIRLTSANAVGSNTTMISGYITAIPLPVASFTANQTSGVLSLPVQFTDTSTNNPVSWTWEYNETTAGSWTQFSIAQNATTVFSTGNYDIRLTATNAAGSDTMTKFGYITVTATPILHTITASAVGGGTIAPSGAVTVNHGGSQTFAITPNPSNHIADVLVDGVSNGTISSYTFTNVIVDHTLSASFAANMPQSLYYNNFEVNFTGWTTSGLVDRNNNAGIPKNGSYSMRLRQTGQMQQTVSTAGYTSITVTFALAANSLESPSGVPEYVQARWYDGATWTQLTRISDGDTNEDNNLHLYSFSLPAGAANNPNFALQFLINGSNNNDYGYVDDVQVIGTHL